MEQVTGMMDTFNTPQYHGELFTADKDTTPLLSMIGGLTGGKQTNDDVFPTAILYNYPEPKQPTISEEDSKTAPDSTFITRTQEKNVVQIFQETISITYAKKSNTGKLMGINTANKTPNPTTELDWQIAQRLVKVARDVEYTFLNGKHKERATTDEPNKTRGVLELITENKIDADKAVLTKEMLDALYKRLADNGAYLTNMVIMVNSSLKQALTQIYHNQFGFNLPSTRSVGGLNIKEIETDFFKAGIVFNRFVPQDTLLVVDVAHLAPVFQTVPDKGNFFLEELAKVGAAETYQLYGQIGLAHGPQFLHGKITNIAV